MFSTILLYDLRTLINFPVLSEHSILSTALFFAEYSTVLDYERSFIYVKFQGEKICRMRVIVENI